MVAGELVFTLSVVVGVTDIAQVVQPATATISLGARRIRRDVCNQVIGEACGRYPIRGFTELVCRLNHLTMD